MALLGDEMKDKDPKPYDEIRIDHGKNVVEFLWNGRVIESKHMQAKVFPDDVVILRNVYGFAIP